MTKYSQHEQAIHIQGFETGGFPVGKKQLVEIFDRNAPKSFDELRQEMRKALMLIESDSMTMEQISSAAHICTVVANGFGKKHEDVSR